MLKSLLFSKNGENVSGKSDVTIYTTVKDCKFYLKHLFDFNLDVLMSHVIVLPCG